MPKELKCIGCNRKNFANDRGLAYHRLSCTAFKRKQQQKVRNLTKPPLETPSEASGGHVINDQAEGFTDPVLNDVDLPDIEPVASPPPEYRKSGLPKRNIRLPKRFLDVLPALPPVVVAPEIETHTPTPTPTPADDISFIPEHTTPNSFGIYRIYNCGAPSFTPNSDFHTDSTSDSPHFTCSGPSSSASWGSPFGIDTTDPDIVSITKNPFANVSICRLMSWFYSGVTKTLKDLNNLVHNVLLAADFKLDDLIRFDAFKEAKKLDDFNSTDSSASNPPLTDGWIKATLSIPLPCAKVLFPSEADAPKYKVEGVYYRKPLEVLKAAFLEHAAQDFHIAPYEEYWQPRLNVPKERIFSELYNTDAYNQEHKNIRSQSHNGCQLETVIAAIMLWSDSTHLTSFGNASLWPIYLYLGNQTKYARTKPSAFAAHHLAYIPKVCTLVLPRSNNLNKYYIYS